MATFASAIQKIIGLITTNSNREITAAKHREVEMEIVQAISESVSEGQIPVMVSGKHVGYATFKFVPGTGELQLDEFRLGRGVQNVNEIFNFGAFTGAASKTLVTKRYVDSRRTVVGIISDAVNLGTSLRVGQTVTLDGGISHTIVEGDTFLLKSQTDAAENVPYTAVAADAVPVVAEWYDAAKNIDILIEKGTAVKQVMPAVAEGADPVITPDLGALAFKIYATNNF